MGTDVICICFIHEHRKKEYIFLYKENLHFYFLLGTLGLWCYLRIYHGTYEINICGIFLNFLHFIIIEFSVVSLVLKKAIILFQNNNNLDSFLVFLLF